MNDYDRISRHEVKSDAPALIGWLFPHATARLRWNGWLDAQSAPRTGEPDRRCDTIAELIDIEGTSPPWACVIELFTEADADAIDRTLEYVGRFRRELRHGPHGHDRYLIAAALIFLTGAPRETGLNMNLPGEEEVGMWFGPRVIDLSAQDAVAHIESIEQNRLSRGLLAWVPLMRGAQSEEIVARWRVQAELVTDETRRKTLIDGAQVFAVLTGCRDLWKQGLEGLLMNESPVMREVRQEGAVATYHSILRSALEHRFPNAVPPALLERVRQETDLATLDRWFKLTLSAASVETLQKEMD
jgi:hypothetical protein